MELKYGALLVEGDFVLRNFKELGVDRDFYIRLDRPVTELPLEEGNLQLPGVRRLLIRASLATSSVGLFFLADSDAASAVASLQFDADRYSMILSAEQTKTLLKLEKNQA